ncbi:hypothetical protein DYB28_015056 [Aphanomyces astaci]|uniref:Uncharacterized protein n=1 Tax=Aphanomyces astaci TaxID=112090 RepID=A0A9X8DIY5_APHAT|nr:hypothetical protein DYB28_015056 [Aphanomyces astaci]
MRALACKILALRMSLHHAMDHGRDKRPTKIALAHSATGISALSEESRGTISGLRTPFHAAHLAAERLFHLDDISIHIKQEWKPDGRGGTELGFGAHVYNAAVMLAFYIHRYDLGEDVDALGAFDVVLGADIIACPYEAAYDALLLSLRHLLASPSTVALVAYKQRHGSEAKFFFKLKKEFDVAVVPKGDYHADFRGEGIDILRLSRKEQRNLS